MGYRRFVDNTGNSWEVRDRSRNEWDFEPVAGNRAGRVTVPAPGYENDPFELSEGELQRLLEGNRPSRSHPTKSPFLD